MSVVVDTRAMCHVTRGGVNGNQIFEILDRHLPIDYATFIMSLR